MTPAGASSNNLRRQTFCNPDPDPHPGDIPSCFSLAMDLDAIPSSDSIEPVIGLHEYIRLFRNIEEISIENKIRIQYESIEQLNRLNTEYSDDVDKQLDDLQVDVIRSIRTLAAKKLIATCPPIKTIACAKKVFFVSKILRYNDQNQRDESILYCLDSEGDPCANLMYKSMSDGNWRVAPHLEGNIYSKGVGCHYIEETKPIDRICLALDKVEILNVTELDKEIIHNCFALPLCRTSGSLLYFSRQVTQIQLSNEVNTALDPIRQIKPGKAFGGPTLSPLSIKRRSEAISEFPNIVRKSLENPLLQGFMPDFHTQSPLFSYKFNHTLFGNTEVEVFLGVLEGKKVAWHMAKESQGRVWVERIELFQAEVSCYGVACYYINAGILTQKPAEYQIQAWMLENAAHFKNNPNIKPSILNLNQPYCDITGFLDLLEPIIQYRAARQIYRPTISRPSSTASTVIIENNDYEERTSSPESFS